MLDQLDNKYDNMMEQLEKKHNDFINSFWGLEACDDEIQEVDVETKVDETNDAGRQMSEGKTKGVLPGMNFKGITSTL